jgi:peptidoglycan/LPS O-acetylase OafA/YrhL
MDRLEQPIDFLDYLRGMAIIAVFLFHCLGAAYGGYQLGWNGLFRTFSGAEPFLLLYPVTFGWLGVAIFIMISGFCSHLSFSRDGLNDLRSFYVRRFFRLYPPYFCILLFIALIWLEYSRMTIKSSSDFVCYFERRCG